MALRGKPSTAHEYGDGGFCIHCHMYKVNIEAMSHVCTAAREQETDAKVLVAAVKANVGVKNG